MVGGRTSSTSSLTSLSGAIGLPAEEPLRSKALVAGTMHRAAQRPIQTRGATPIGVSVAARIGAAPTRDDEVDPIPATTASSEATANARLTSNTLMADCGMKRQRASPIIARVRCSIATSTTAIERFRFRPGRKNDIASHDQTSPSARSSPPRSQAGRIHLARLRKQRRSWTGAVANLATQGEVRERPNRAHC